MSGWSRGAPLGREVEQLSDLELRRGVALLASTSDWRGSRQVNITTVQFTLGTGSEL